MEDKANSSLKATSGNELDSNRLSLDNYLLGTKPEVKPKVAEIKKDERTAAIPTYKADSEDVKSKLSLYPVYSCLDSCLEARFFGFFLTRAGLF